MKRILFLPVFLVISGPLAAHDFWIEPDQFAADSGTPVNISLREGVGFKGNSLPYITQWFNDFSVTSTGGRTGVESELGNDPAATLALQAGTYLLGYQSNANFVELEPEKFHTYLEEEGMEYIIMRRQELGEEDELAPENFVRCAKTLIGVTGSRSVPDVYAKRLGYTLELVPESDPLLVEAGDSLTMRVLYAGAPIEGIRVRALTKDRPEESIDVRSDADGRASLVLPRPGIWMIKAVHIIELAEGRDPDIIAAHAAAGQDPPPKWESYWASYLFELQ